MHTERILLSENPNLAKEISADIKQFNPLLYDLKKAYEDLELGAFTDEVFKELSIKGAGRILKMYVDKLNAQLDKIGITSNLIRTNAISESDTYCQNLQEALRKVKGLNIETHSATGRPSLGLEHISYGRVGFYVSGEEEITERFCRVYAETPEQIKLLKIAMELQSAFERYIQFLIENSIVYNRLNPFATMALILTKATDQPTSINAASLIALSKFREGQDEYNRKRSEFQKSIK